MQKTSSMHHYTFKIWFKALLVSILQICLKTLVRELSKIMFKAKLTINGFNIIPA